MTESDGNSSKTLDEAIHWVIVLNSPDDVDGDLDTVAPRFQAWLDAAPGHATAFWAVQDMWERLGILTDRPQWGLDELPAASLDTTQTT